MADKVKVYCKDCEFLYESTTLPSDHRLKEYTCKHPSNLRSIYNWYSAKEESIIQPQELNADNDCPMFKRKGK